MRVGLVTDVTAAVVDRLHAGDVGDRAVARDRVADAGDDVVDRVADVVVAGQLVRVERRPDGLHEADRGGALRRVRVPVVLGVRVPARLVLDDHGDVGRVHLVRGDAVGREDLLGLADPVTDLTLGRVAGRRR